MHNVGLHTQSFRSQLSSETKGKHQADAKGTHPPLHLTSVVRRRSEESGDDHVVGTRINKVEGEGQVLTNRDREEVTASMVWSSGPSYMSL